ncbi:hypothetical protein [Breznakiella homolactica]|uniref:Variant SH3 domain-containing protein n=1 Tax=Breznakiella homolactica TaxID=2798577 RepID=A0A7T8BCE5_9SPIR|nr:hypothetical protein [Breznakiella homolactica]QQO10173.1 hypothetical protein JFL75_04425 [Breznakiella homolactica]
MEYIAVKPHRTEYPDPITVTAGEEIIPGEKSDENGNWPGWVFCTKLDGSNAGWLPAQIIRREGNTAAAAEDYSAAELNVDPGEILRGTRILNGWVWAEKKNAPGQGWVPLENLEPA